LEVEILAVGNSENDKLTKHLLNRIDGVTGDAEITEVFFDEPRGVELQGSLKRTADSFKEKESPYR
jgi:hypothetical protein